jgi:hypothetical protein
MPSVAERNLRLTKAQIWDLLIKKYETEWKIKKWEYGNNPQYDCYSNKEEEKMEKE